ncbi:C4-dicarboxylate transporter, DctQ subunit [Oceanospirillum multiglobuliferum]|uniref:TRAP transporter small permease protein n=1 Tax=Oceanospirillum multiglobuliferum TaxID=64969 RepID=A0A1T4M5V7_9GAMM|nr:TRAP transporter small permease [Oceanospirillum multiglobuliferum]OPX56375.1 C4-dicarboxylate ABC transporter permease [Oceanospirillum multiglobuliferum]SJZ62400.1 C4-dicarboxylate transporter, DctQ subunit [Oceanospirillum multiglobuliferum]
MLLRFIHKLEENIVAFLLVAITLMVFMEVVMRFVFNSGVTWIQEATLYTSAWFVLFGASYGVRIGAHIGVDVLVKLLPDPLRRVAGLIAIALCFVYCALFLLGSWDYLELMYMIGIEMEDLPIPKWMALMIMPIGFVLLVIRFAELGWGILTGQKDGFHLADEGKESMHLAEELAKENANKDSSANNTGASK